MIGVIGLGQAGGNIANLFAEREIVSAAINYSTKDLETCNFIEHKLKLIGSEGVGKQREEAIRLFHNNYETAVSFIKEHFSAPSTELIFIIFSAGGGSGSGIASLLSELLINEMDDKTFVICPILPVESECITAHLNTLDTLTSLSELEACILPIDNEKGMLNEGRGKSYKLVNETFVDSILSLINYTEKHSVNGNFDSKDLITLLSTQGFGSFGEVDISKLDCNGISLTDNNIAELIQGSQLKSILTNPSYDQVVRACLIYEGQESLLRYINVPMVMSQFRNQPLDIFEGYYEGEKGRVITIFTGLKFNAERLSKIEQLATNQITSFQDAHKSTVISVNRPTISVTKDKSKSKKALSDILNKHKRSNILK